MRNSRLLDCRDIVVVVIRDTTPRLRARAHARPAQRNL
jgi:hypothetical protein